MLESASFVRHRGGPIRSVAMLALTAGAVGLLAGPAPAGGTGQIQVPTTLADFFQPGTQPTNGGAPFVDILPSGSCSSCHGNYLGPDSDNEPWDAWVASAMAQSARDPVWHAALAIANQDTNFSGEYCIRCHAPGAWLGGRSVPTDTSGFITGMGLTEDFDGVNCHFCHRVVNPVFEGDSPIEDVNILADLDFPPGGDRGNARYVVDPDDVRRGPYQDIAENEAMNMHGVPVIYSPVHRRSEQCGTCHDVANPAYLRLPDGTYVLEDEDSGHGPGMEHPTQQIDDMFPEQRTYSEWLQSQFANGGVQFDDGRFGGAHPTGLMQECQDCHMPDQVAGGCFAWEFDPWFERTDLPQHSFAGSNTWLMRLVREVYDDGDTGLNPENVAAAEARAADMLRAASDVQVTQRGDSLKVRVINWSGHKLPTGYPEGRRMWLNVKYYDGETPVDERGAYDYDEAILSEDDTKVYKMELGISPEVAALVNLPAGPSFRLTLVDQILLDNRIPPVGFTNAGFESILSAPVNYSYEDGQHWDDTEYDIPNGATRAVVTLYYQPMTREYIEFLKNENVTPDNDWGDVVHAMYWDMNVGQMVPPTDMDTVEIELTPPLPGDTNGDGAVNFPDLLAVLAGWGPCPGPDLCPADLDCDGDVDFDDLLAVLAGWTG